MIHMKSYLKHFFPVLMFFALSGSSYAAILTNPGFGGGQGHQGYMIMPEPYVDLNHQVQIPIENQGPAGYIPWLIPEKPGDYYTNKWSVLNDKAYCRDWGWFDSLSNLGPDQTWWIKLESHTGGLVTYNGAGNLIFQNDGDWWNFQGGMLHNVYAIPTPAYIFNVSATYKVYVGDAARNLDPAITPGTVSFVWKQRIPGDANLDGKVNVSDLGILATNYGSTTKTDPTKFSMWEQGDFSMDWVVNVSDLGILATNYGFGTQGTGSIPEPLSLILWSLGGFLCYWNRRGKP